MKPTVVDYKKLDQNLALMGTKELEQRTLTEEPEKEPSTWEEPIIFRDAEVERFPFEVLPSSLSAIIAEISEVIQVPVDLPAMVALSACAVPLAKKLEIRIAGDHVEPLNLYTLTIMESGTRKTPVFKPLTGPIYNYEREIRELKEPEIKAMRQAYKTAEEELRSLTTQAVKTKDPLEKERIKQEGIDLAKTIEEPPGLPRILADDVTQERLAVLMLENNQRMAILSAEGDFFDTLGRYEKNGKANLGLLVKSHSGDAWHGDRMTREGTLKSPALTLGLLGQRDILRGLLEQPSFRGRGLLARFLYSIPPVFVGSRAYHREPISEMANRSYSNMLKRLFEIPWGGTPEEREPHTLTLSNQSLEEWRRFYEEVESDLAPGAPLNWLADWGSKLPGQVARIAGILHCVTMDTSSPWEIPVSVETILAAIALGHYFRSHAVASFREMGANKSEGEAQAVLAWIERHEIMEFKAGEVLGTLSRFHNMADLQPVLDLLKERNFIREILRERQGKTGRQPKPVYEVNPYFLEPTSKTSNTSKRV